MKSYLIIDETLADVDVEKYKDRKFDEVFNQGVSGLITLASSLALSKSDKMYIRIVERTCGYKPHVADRLRFYRTMLATGANASVELFFVKERGRIVGKPHKLC